MKTNEKTRRNSNCGWFNAAKIHRTVQQASCRLMVVPMILLMMMGGGFAQQLPSHVNFQELGLRFEIPTGWNGYVEGEYVLMGHHTIPGLMIMSESQATSAAQLKQLAMQGLSDADFQLQPAAEFSVVDENRVEGFYQGHYQGAQVKAYATGLINGSGAGVNIMVLTATERFTPQHQAAANKLASTVRFFQPKELPATQMWKQKISGYQLKFMHTASSADYQGGYTGSSDKVFIGLCASGGFTYYASSLSSYDGSGGFGHAGNSGNESGQYKIYSNNNQTYLSLNFSNGEAHEYQLTTNQQGNTLLDGRRYFVSDLESCD